MPRYGENVWRWGRRRNTERKSGLLDFNAWIFFADHLALCTPGLTEFSAGSCRLKSSSKPCFCSLKICQEMVEDGVVALSNLSLVLHLPLRKGSGNWFEKREDTKLNFTDVYILDLVWANSKFCMECNLLKVSHNFRHPLSDMDECSLGSHNCSQHAKCFNFAGSFACQCDSEYSGNGTFCQG